MCLDGLFEVDDGNPVNREGAFASVNDVVDDGFNAVGVGRLVTSGRGVDGEWDDNEAAHDLGACPDVTFCEAKGLDVLLGGGVVGHINKCRGVSRRDMLDGGGGLCGWEEVTLRVWEFITVIVVGVVSDGGVGGLGFGWSSHGSRGKGRVEVGPDGRAMTSRRKPWVGGGGGGGGIEPRRPVGCWVRGGPHWLEWGRWGRPR